MPKQVESISELFKTRQNFMIIGLTGRTGSGCSTAARLLSSSFDKIQAPTPQAGTFMDSKVRSANEERKYKILHSFAKENWHNFHLIRVRNIIASFIVNVPFDKFVDFVSETLNYNAALKEKVLNLLKLEIRKDFEAIHKKSQTIKFVEGIPTKTSKRQLEENLEETYEFYFEDLENFTKKLNEILKRESKDIFIRLYQAIGDNIRASGNPILNEFNSKNIFAIPKRINQLIKVLRKRAKKENPSVFIVIDAIRNPFEAHFFNERYSAFYLIAINTPDGDRISRLRTTLDISPSQIKEIDDKEYPKKLSGYKRFVSQDIQKCIEIADIHVNNPNEKVNDNNLLKRQLIWFISLVMHPGLVIPTATERAMQIAYTAKMNSGCISRQVGAVVTDKSFSVKAVGWNNTPEGQVPCILRSVEDLLSKEDQDSFSSYELSNEKFRNHLETTYDKQFEKKGRNLSFCFKDVQNSLDGEKNQVHTRSLHAEENAFLQITKYGGEGVIDGILFTTASPCELCAKKAYQLGISKIIYIDPYPGIATSHVLRGGTKKISLELFSGAIGKAYYQLYQSYIPYKDELNILFEIELPKKKSEHENENILLKKQIASLEKKLKGIETK